MRSGNSKEGSEGNKKTPSWWDTLTGKTSRKLQAAKEEIVNLQQKLTQLEQQLEAIKQVEKQSEQSHLVDNQLSAGLGAMSVMIPTKSEREEPSSSNATDTNHKEQTFEDFIRENKVFARINNQNLELGNKVLTLQQKGNSLHDEIAKLRNEAKEEKQQHNSKACEQTKKIKDLKLEITELQKIIQSLTSTSSVMEDEKKKLEITELQNTIQSLTSTLSAMEDEKKKLEAKIAHYTKVKGDISSHNQAIQNEFRELISITKSKDATRSLHEENKEFKTQLSNKEAKLKIANTKIAELETQLKDLQSQLEIANQGNQALVKANRTSQEDLKAKDEKIAKLQTSYQAAKRGLERLTDAELKTKDEEITELGRKLATANQYYRIIVKHSLNSKFIHNNDLSTMQQQIMREIEDLQSQLEIANQDNEALVEANRTSQEDLKAKDEKIAKLQAAKRGLERLTDAELKTKDEEITELGRKYCDLENKYEDMVLQNTKKLKELVSKTTLKKAAEETESFKSMLDIALATCAVFIFTTIALAISCVYMMTQNAESVVMNSVLSNSGPDLTR